MSDGVVALLDGGMIAEVYCDGTMFAMLAHMPVGEASIISRLLDFLG